MIANYLVADVGLLERQPTAPPLADKIKSLLERNAPRDLLERVAGGRDNLRHIMRTYLAPPKLPPIPQPMTRLAIGLPPRPAAPVPEGPAPLRKRDRQRWLRRGEVLRLQLDSEWQLAIIEAVVCASYGVGDELAGRSATKKTVAARVAFCLLARAHVGFASVAQITRYIGRDHATLHHYETHKARYMSCPDFARRYAAAESEIAAAFAE
jgi:hypothetical protein